MLLYRAKWAFVCALALACCTCRHVWALEALVLHSAAILPEQSLTKPTRLVQIDAQTYCFVADRGGRLKPSKATICSFDSGQSFGEVILNVPFCGDLGIVRDGVLWCPDQRVTLSDAANTRHGRVDADTSSGDDVRGHVDLLYTANSFTAGKDSLHVGNAALDQANFTFRINTSMMYPLESSSASLDTAESFTGALMQFNGNTLFDTRRDLYVMAASVLRTEGAVNKTALLLVSADGLLWRAVQRLPCRNAETMTLLRGEHNSFLLVCEKGGRQVIRVSLSLGRQWSSATALNSTATPISVVLPSGVAIKHNLINSTFWYTYNVLSHVNSTNNRNKSKDSANGSVNATQNITTAEDADALVDSKAPKLTTRELTWGVAKKRAVDESNGSEAVSDTPSLEVRASSVLPSRAPAVAILVEPEDDKSRVLIVYEEEKASIASFIPKAWRKSGGGLHSILLSLNDTAENMLHTQELERRQEKARQRTERAENLQKQKLERLARERSARQRRREERYKLFTRADEHNIAKAIHDMNVDGELIIVRETDKSSFEFELSTFFSDIMISLDAKDNVDAN